MKKIFHSQNPAPRMAGSTTLLSQLLALWQQMKKRICHWLNRKTDGWTVRQAKAALVLFCLTFVCLSLAVTWKGLYRRHDGMGSIISIPSARLKVADTAGNRAGRLVPAIAYQHVLILQRWLDSLARADSTKYRHIFLLHPTLLSQLQWLDSIHQFENASLWNPKRFH